MVLEDKFITFDNDDAGLSWRIERCVLAGMVDTGNLRDIMCVKLLKERLCPSSGSVQFSVDQQRTLAPFITTEKSLLSQCFVNEEVLSPVWPRLHLAESANRKHTPQPQPYLLPYQQPSAGQMQDDLAFFEGSGRPNKPY